MGRQAGIAGQQAGIRRGLGLHHRAEVVHLGGRASHVHLGLGLHGRAEVVHLTLQARHARDERVAIVHRRLLRGGQAVHCLG